MNWLVKPAASQSTTKASFFSVPFVYYPNGSVFTGSGSCIAKGSYDYIFSGLSF